MDDAPRARFLKTAVIAGLLVLLGAGCAKAEPVGKIQPPEQTKRTEQDYPIKPDGTIEYPKTQEDKEIKKDLKIVDFSVLSVCLDGFQTYDDFIWEMNNNLNVYNFPSGLEEKIKKDYSDGWRIHKVCYTNALEISLMKYGFGMTKTNGVTEKEAVSIVRAVSFKDQKLKPDNFDGNSGWSLMKFRYFGFIQDAPGEGGTAGGAMESKLFAVNGGPNQAGFLENLSLFRDVNDRYQNYYLKAQTSGGDNDSYYADVEYRPMSDSLNFKVCASINHGKELGQDIRFSCQ
ncbi:MAG: hypothetical protein WC641_02220 [Patescibacteria group bacterium]